MDKSTWTKNILFALFAASIIGAVVHYNAIAVRRGETDYALIAEGKLPLYAKCHAGIADGGTIWYKGSGYSVYRVHSLHQQKGVEGYLVGPRIRYLPFILAGKNRESLRFEAEIEDR